MDGPQEFLQKFSWEERSGRRVDIEVPHAELDGAGEKTRRSAVACDEEEHVAAATADKPAGGHPSVSDSVEQKHVPTPAGWSNVLNPGHWGTDAEEKSKEAVDVQMQKGPEDEEVE